MVIQLSDIDISNYIDHALLNPIATSEQLKECCYQANQYNFPTVCIYPSAVKEAVALLHNQKPQICAVIAFPTGATTTTVKLYEALEAVENGATELDVVINLGWLKEGKSEAIYNEMAQICSETGQSVKAILETNLLSDEEKKLAAEICMDAGVHFLKTGTGYFGGVTLTDVQFLAKITQGKVGIKAAGGIKEIQQALKLIQAGATRLGTSKGIDLVNQQLETLS